MLLKKGILILCLVYFGIAHSQSKEELSKLAIAKISPELKSAYQYVGVLSDYLPKIKFSHRSKNAVERHSKGALSASYSITSHLNKVVFLTDKSLTEYKQLKKVKTVPQNIIAKGEKLKKSVQLLKAYNDKVESHLSYVKLFKNNPQEVLKKNNLAAKDGKGLAVNFKEAINDYKALVTAYLSALDQK